MKIVPADGGGPIGTKRANKHNCMMLYYFPGACALADHIVLEWIGALYEPVRMSRASIKTLQALQSRRKDMAYHPTTSGWSHLLEGVFLGVSIPARNQKLNKMPGFSA
jgi:hypothetical protein